MSRITISTKSNAISPLSLTVAASANNEIHIHESNSVPSKYRSIKVHNFILLKTCNIKYTHSPSVSRTKPGGLVSSAIIRPVVQLRYEPSRRYLASTRRYFARNVIKTELIWTEIIKILNFIRILAELIPTRAHSWSGRRINSSVRILDTFPVTSSLLWVT